MRAKHLKSQLLNSPNLKNFSRRSEDSRLPSETQSDNEEIRSDLSEILAKEQQVTRAKAENRNLKEIALRREELAKKLGQLVSELKLRRAKADEHLEFCREQISKLKDFPAEVSVENLSECRRLIRQVDLELLKSERDLYGTDISKDDSHPPGISLTDLPFLDLVKIGLGLFLPIIVAFLAGSVFIGTVLLKLFRL